MIDWAHRMLEGIQSLPLWNIALFFSVCGMLQALIPVFPGDIVLLIGAGVWTGGLMGSGFWPVLVSYWLGTTAASLALTEVGRLFGDHLLSKPWLRRLFPAARQEQAARWLEKRGAPTIFAAKFILGMNLPILFLCGIMEMPRRKAYPAVILTTAVHNTLFYVLGSVVGLNWDSVRGFLAEYELIAALLVVLGVSLAVWVRVRISSAHRKDRDG